MEGGVGVSSWFFSLSINIYLRQKLPHGDGNLLDVRFQGEVSGVEELDRGIGIVPLKGFSTWGNEVEIMLAPDRQQRRLRGAEILLKLRIQLHVVGIVEKQVQLNVHIAGSR